MRPIHSLLLTALALSTAIAIAADQPNIVLLYADDLGYGATRVATPNIDRLAREGLRLYRSGRASGYLPWPGSSGGAWEAK